MKRSLLAITSVLWLASACQQEVTVIAQPDKTALSRPLLQLDARKATDLLIPEKAIVMRGGVPGVFVLQDNEARFRMVKPARQQGSQRQILSGLQGNETLVLGSLQEVHDGSPIMAEQ